LAGRQSRPEQRSPCVFVTSPYRFDAAACRSVEIRSLKTHVMVAFVMNLRSLAAAALIACGILRAQPPAGALVNPLLPSGADPWIIWHDGFYYYMNTTGNSLKIWKTRSLAQLGQAESKVFGGRRRGRLTRAMCGRRNSTSYAASGTSTLPPTRALTPRT